MHPLYGILLADVGTDISQMGEEGHDEQALARELAQVKASGSADALLAFQQDLWSRPSPPDFPYDEPDEWEAISRDFPAPPPSPGEIHELGEWIYGGWLGRTVGCQMGKPLEGAWPREAKAVLTAAGSWPLTGYLSSLSDSAYERLAARSQAFRRYYDRSLVQGAFSSAAPDDDLHYAITSQLVLERHGFDFAPTDAVKLLLELTPTSCLWAAGRNLFRTADFGLAPPHTARYGNPCRQSLGGQIRCDPFGWAAPGRPQVAAWLAYKDASNSQRRNGIYSAMFFSALIARVLGRGDVGEAIAAAYRYVPPQSRFAEMVRFMLEQCRRHADWQEVNRALYRRYDEQNPRADSLRVNHALPNAAIVLMALLKGGGSFAHSVGIAVMAGMDTDCNAATVGSIMGCAVGAHGIPSHLAAPLNDTVRTQLKDLPEVRISDLAHRMCEVAERNLARAPES